MLKENQLKLPSGKIITFNSEQFDGYKKIMNWLKNGKTFFTLSGYAGTGKQQPIDCIVQTPNGQKKIGDLNIGDEIYGIDGTLIKVNGIFPQGIKQAYKITFRDGSYTECGEEHLWDIWTKKMRQLNKPTKTVTTKEIIDDGLKYKNGNYKFSIPLCKPIKYQVKELPIHPYLLGVLIGDGCLVNSTVNISVPDIDNEIIEHLKIPSYITLKKDNSSSCPRYNFVQNNNEYRNKFKKIISDLGLNVKSEFKFIPNIYKYASIEQRLELLRGLMDTDGTSKGNRIGYSTSSAQLKNDIIELVQSLSGTAILNKDDNRNKNVNYSINIKMFECPFKIKRKSQNWKFSKKNPPSRYITSIKKSRICEQICISVDSDDGLYLTNDFIVTHNSTIIKKVLDNYHGGVVVSAPTHKAKKVVMSTTHRDGQTLHALLGLRPDLQLDDFNPNDPKFNPIAIPRISDYNLVIIDEASMINEDLYNLILEKTINDKHNKGKTKVMFIGDPAQIPPVGEKESVVFLDKTIENHHLTKVERQNDDNPLMQIYDDLRNNLLIDDGGFKRITKINDNDEGVIFLLNKKKFRTAILEKLTSNDFIKNTDFAKVIAWRNETVMQANKVIREEIIGKDVDIVEIGDILMGYRSVADGRFRNIIENSADYRVMKKSKLTENSYGINGYNVTIKENLPNGKFMFENIFIIDALNRSNLHLYAQQHDFFRDEGKRNRRNWDKYYEFRKNNILMKTIDEYQNREAREKWNIIAKDMDYGYTITGHKCLSENSNIYLLNGIKKLKNVNINDVINIGSGKYSKILDKIYVGKKKAFKLTTSFGYEIICSEDHRIMDINKNFKRLKDLNCGEYLPINRNNNKIPNIKINNRGIYYYLGLLVADGSYSGNNKKDKYRINLTIGYDDIDNIFEIKRFLNDNKIKFGEYHRKKSNCVNIYVSNKNWRNKLHKLGLKYVKGNKKSIPESVLNGTYQNKSDFISGLFDGDGNVSKKGIRFTNNSLKLIKECQTILLEFGIVSYYRKQKKSYVLSVLGTSINEYSKYISFRLNRKLNLLNEYKTTTKTNKDFIPHRDKILNTVKNDIKNKNIWMKKNTGINPSCFRKFPSYSKHLTYKQLENIVELYRINKKTVNPIINELLNDYFFYDKIISIEEFGVEEMYDLEIENIHQFVADGFIVHNSQGSTYTHVFIMENDINANWQLKERNQIKYVALTRPTKTATILTTKIDC